ncbi:MaoC/PaaZ C-terminal domain-containing protein [Lysinibacillus sp. LZ02]|uniref:MaoC/PaaZ C-terminal domain-containing protein n=1 Tax=Lysinibacillus sp. LZ02 TaxID=3420668 RepID=UPI003D36970B
MAITEQSIDVVVFEELQVGQLLPSYQKPPITKVQLVKYAGASGDFNPLHTDDAFAQKIGMPGVIAHGMLVMGFLGEYVMKLAGDVAQVKQFSMRFGAMTLPGDAITCIAQVKEIHEREVVLELTAQKQDQTVVGSGKATLCF